MSILIKWKFIKILLIILLKLLGYCKCLSTVVNITPPPPPSPPSPPTSSSSSSSSVLIPRRMFNFTLVSSPSPFLPSSTTPSDLLSASTSLLSSTNELPTPLSLILMKHNNYEQKQAKFNNESEFNLVKQFLNLNKNLTLQMNNNNYVPHIPNLNISDINVNNNSNSFSNSSNNYYHRPLSLKLNNTNNFYHNKKYNNYPKIKNNYTEFFVTSPLTNKTKNYNKLIYQDINVDNLDDFSDDSDDIVDADVDDDDDEGAGRRHDGEHGLNHLDHSFHDFNVNNMYFGTENYTVITSQIGSTAMVPCSVHHIGDGVVTWIRRKDYHLLTVGLTTYSSDERFSTVHLQHSEDWTLQIKFVQLRDAGIYECQVSTHPPTSIFIQLNVVENFNYFLEARAEIIGPSEKYLKPGSPLRLVCKVMSSTEPPLYIFWYHNNRMINYDGGITVSTESDNRYSELVIASTTITHSGNYSCVPNSAAAASIYVHIFNGENPAAIHHVGHGNKLNSFNIRNFLIVIFLLFMKQF